MNTTKNEIKCAYCKAYLFEEDDIVYCPTCGAPHHRECYNKINKCALEELHGTENQYDNQKNITENVQPEIKIEYTKCSVCGEEYDETLRKCPKCSSPNFTGNPIFAQFNFLGGIPKDYNLGDGITAEEARQFVFSNTQRYIPKFASLTNKNKNSWNWLAFLFPAAWSFSRKMYKNGIILGILSIISSLFTLPFIVSLSNIGSQNLANYPQIVQFIIENLPNIHISVVIAYIVGLLLSLVLSIFAGIKGDYIYKKHTLSTIKSIKKDSDDLAFDFHKKGGVNFFSFILCTMILQYIPQIIFMYIR